MSGSDRGLFQDTIRALGRSQWPRGLRRRSASARLLRLWVRIPPGAWMSVWCEHCVLSGRGLCNEPITRPEGSYRLYCVVVCDLETSWMRRSWPNGGCCAKKKKKTNITSTWMEGLQEINRHFKEQRLYLTLHQTHPKYKAHSLYWKKESKDFLTLVATCKFNTTLTHCSLRALRYVKTAVKPTNAQL